MEKINCLIVDDEPLALDLLQGYVEKTPFLKLCGRANSALEALEYLSTQSIHLLFLDIQMPGLTGTDFARSLRNGPRIIFSTAFPNYAVEGFRLDAIDYLVKPYDYAEFLRAAQKAKDVILTQAQIQSAPFFFVKSEYKMVRIDIERILYIEGMKDYAKIYLQGEARPVITLMSLKSLVEKLPDRDFLRIHRSYIIHLKFVACVERSSAMIGTVAIPIAEKYKPILDNRLDGVD